MHHENIFPADYGGKLKEMQDSREDADYRFEQTVDRAEARKRLEFATEFVSKVLEQIDKKLTALASQQQTD